jgi:hypothetical protein
VRHVRMLGLCLVAIFATSAMAAGPTLATKYNLPKEYKVFSDCPRNNTEFPREGEKGFGEEHVDACIYAKSNSSSYFQAGNAIVHMVHPVTLQGGVFENESGTQFFIPPEHGTSVLSKVAQPAPSLTEGVDPELLPPPEKTRYEKLVAEGKTAVTATIETAGPYNSEVLNETNLITEEGTALKFPVQVKLSNPFLGKGCYIGSNASPIIIELTTGPSGELHGKRGELNFRGEGGILEIKNNELVNNTYASPGATGCGSYGGADAAINAALHLPAPTGANKAIIAGTLEQTGNANMRELEEQGRLP